MSYLGHHGHKTTSTANDSPEQKHEVWKCETTLLLINVDKTKKSELLNHALKYLINIEVSSNERKHESLKWVMIVFTPRERRNVEKFMYFQKSFRMAMDLHKAS